MKMGAKLDETVNGLNYMDRTFMIAGYLKDYKPIVVDVHANVDESPNGEKTYLDFKENRGYVDNDGYVWIFRSEPNEKEEIPWFTIVTDSDMNSSLKFNPRTVLYDKDAFHISNVGDASPEAIIEQTTDKPVEYDEAVLEAVARATTTVNVTINPEDDFLKKIVKEIIILKGVDVNKYKAEVPKTWMIHNLVNALRGKTKIGPKPFMEWLELLGCDVEIKVIDNGRDKEDPLRQPFTYSSATGKFQIGDKKEDKDDNGDTMARSIKA